MLPDFHVSIGYIRTDRFARFSCSKYFVELCCVWCLLSRIKWLETMAWCMCIFM